MPQIYAWNCMDLVGTFLLIALDTCDSLWKLATACPVLSGLRHGIISNNLASNYTTALRRVLKRSKKNRLNRCYRCQS